MTDSAGMDYRPCVFLCKNGIGFVNQYLLYQNRLQITEIYPVDGSMDIVCTIKLGYNKYNELETKMFCPDIYRL